MKWNSDGLVPAVIQHDRTGEVLMLAYQNQEAFERTMATGEVWLYSRSRNRLWHKGETSGNRLIVTSISLDCDCDTVLLSVLPLGPVCHTGSSSCFNSSNRLYAEVYRLEDCIAERHRNPSSRSYTSSLFAAGLDRIAQKVGEEAVETIIAAKNECTGALLEETADLVYHLLVLLHAKSLTWNNVMAELAKRRQRSDVNKHQ